MPQPGQAWRPVCEAVLMIRPRRCSRMILPPAREQAIIPLTLTANTRSTTSSGVSITSAIGCATPALFARMSSEPCSRAISAKAASTAVKSVTSSRIAAADLPSGLAGNDRAVGAASIMSAQTTTAPSCASARAIPAPRPRAEPVTMATRLSRRPIMLPFHGVLLVVGPRGFAAGGRVPASRLSPLSVGAELTHRPTVEIRLVDVRLAGTHRRVRDEHVLVGRTRRRRCLLGIRRPVELLRNHLLAAREVAVDGSDGELPFEIRGLETGAVFGAAQEVGQVPVAGSADDDHVLPGLEATRAKRLNDARRKSVVLGVDEVDALALRRGNHLRPDLVAVRLAEARVLARQDLQLHAEPLHLAEERRVAVVTRRVAGREADDQRVASRAVELDAVRQLLLARLGHQLRRNTAVEEVVDAGVRDPPLIGSLQRILVRHHRRDAARAERAQGRDASLVVDGPPDVRVGLRPRRQLLAHLVVLLGLVELVLDDLDRVAERLRLRPCAFLPLGEIVVGARRHEDDDRAALLRGRRAGTDTPRRTCDHDECSHAEQPTRLAHIRPPFGEPQDAARLQPFASDCNTARKVRRLRRPDAPRTPRPRSSRRRRRRRSPSSESRCRSRSRATRRRGCTPPRPPAAGRVRPRSGGAPTLRGGRGPPRHAGGGEPRASSSAGRPSCWRRRAPLPSARRRRATRRGALPSRAYPRSSDLPVSSTSTVSPLPPPSFARAPSAGAGRSGRRLAPLDPVGNRLVDGSVEELDAQPVEALGLEVHDDRRAVGAVLSRR